MAQVLYVDIDGTLVGPGGDLLANDNGDVVDAVLRARAAGLTLVPVTGRGRVQVRELCRLLGFHRGIAELGCVHVDGSEVRYELGSFPFTGETPVEAMLAQGAIAVVTACGLEPHDPWNEGREATFLLRGEADVAAVNAALAERGFSWCELIDNGRSLSRGGHVYHAAPTGTGKAFGVRIDRERHGVDRDVTAYVGDSASDLACASEVGQLWLVANADPALEWPHKTAAPYGAGVAEVIDALVTTD